MKRTIKRRDTRREYYYLFIQDRYLEYLLDTCELAKIKVVSVVQGQGNLYIVGLDVMPEILFDLGMWFADATRQARDEFSQEFYLSAMQSRAI